MDAIIFNIQKFSLHDGPGIRTVVFFKGCPMRCLWCSNPESQHMGLEALRDGDGTTQAGEARGLDSVLHACLQDRDFYEESGGGVTLSGGEPMMQPAFAVALLDALRGEGVHTAIETAGFAKPGVFEGVAGSADLLLFDVKHWDEARHIKGTGVSNAPIWENLRRAVRMGVEVLPRIPVIPGYNDAPEDARRFAEALNEVRLNRAQLLPFHQFGERKYEQLGREYRYQEAEPLRERDLTEYLDAMAERGIQAFI